MTDHKEEAERRLNLVTGNGVGGMTSGEYIGNRDHEVAMAQVHAILYAAEQQRIANLIALSREALGEEVSFIADEAVNGLVAIKRIPATPISVEDESVTMRVEIKKVLGLS